MTAKIRVLVVDDSAFARKVVRDVLEQSKEVEIVGWARDGLEALEMVAELKPDVVTLDLLMPNLDGLGVLRALPSTDGPRVVVVSVTPEDSDMAVEALTLGAIELVRKPTALATDRLYEIGDELVNKVRAAGASRGRRPAEPVPLPPRSLAASGRVQLVCIGCSTGGPQALTRLIPALPKTIPVPVCVAVHMPAGFTDSLAQRLDSISEISVVEASDEMVLEPGRVVIAPGGSHLTIQRRGTLVAKVGHGPDSELHRPSIDLLFNSAADELGEAVLAVVLTGMGDDGLKGAKRIVDRGGRVLTESAASCVVHGMPRSVLEAGLSAADVPLDRIASEILRRL
jgi:two-component system chemotaxis response regulator CheB